MGEICIFLVEDDESIRELVLYALKSVSFEARGFEDSVSFWKVIEKQLPSLVLLDIMMPGDDGLEVLTRMKKNSRMSNIPVIMLTAKASEYDKVKGLDLGADDYISKPFGVMELLSRIRAVLRRSGKDPLETPPLHWGDITLDEARRSVVIGGTSVTLTYKEFELLAFLMKNAGIVLSRERIMDRVWGFDFEGESRTVDMHIKSLRQKLGSHGESIQTVRSVGYRLGVTTI